MDTTLAAFYEQVNHTRYRGQRAGHYESFFVRANHPSRPLAFWIRYTIFSPKRNVRRAAFPNFGNRPENALGELWAVFFDGESNRHAVLKQEFPLADCEFDNSSFRVRIGSASLGSHALEGTLNGKANTLAWQLAYDGDSPPLLLLPRNLYEGGFPAAKSLVSLPLARFNGALTVDGETITIADWVGSQNHNWGTRHTDLYAWGQVAGFDDHPESFLEVATARLRLGPFWTPPITPLVLRHRGQEYDLTALAQTIRARGTFRYFTWEFRSATDAVDIAGRISAPAQSFVGLNYYNPPGGSKHCLNTKIADCTLSVWDKATGTTEVLQAAHRAAFEILTDDRAHGIAIAA